jgi:hypothetical protein
LPSLSKKLILVTTGPPTVKVTVDATVDPGTTTVEASTLLTEGSTVIALPAESEDVYPGIV